MDGSRVSRFLHLGQTPRPTTTSSPPLREFLEIRFGPIDLAFFDEHTEGRKMRTYHVIWRIDIQAESAVAAAERARDVQRNVVEQDHPGIKRRVNGSQGFRSFDGLGGRFKATRFCT